MGAANILAKMSVIIDGQTAEFNKALKETSNNLNLFTGGINKIAGLAAGAFGVSQVASFALEVSKVAGETKGVSAAFDRLPNSTKLMEDLKAATGNTVSELDLMKRSVQASNFDISLAALPKLLQFATLRAQQTGQSVDYLVDSIITGIGRKSPLILDNLGISATKLKEKLGGVSLEAAGVGKVAEAVGLIAEESLGNMAGFSENASTEIQRLGASWENAKAAIGKASNETGVLNGALVFMRDILDAISGDNGRKIAILSGELAGFIKGGVSSRVDETVTKFKELRKEIGKPIDVNLIDLEKKYELTGAQALELQSKIREINNSLSDQERKIRIFDNFKKGYKDVATAADAFVVAQIRSIDAFSAQLDTERLFNELGGKGNEQRIANLENEIRVRYELIALAEEQKKAFLKTDDANTSQVETIATLEAKLKEYQDQAINTDITEQGTIATIHKKSEALKEQIEYLKALVPLSRGATSPLGPEPKVANKTGADFLSDTNTTAQNFKANSETISKYIDQVNSDFLKKQDGINSWGKSFLDTTANVEQWGETTRLKMEQVEAHTIHLNAAIAQGLSSFADALGQAAVGVGNFGDNIIKAVAGFMRSFGEQLIALGVAAAAADVLVENPYTAIAAGVALVALAGAATAATSKAQKGITGNRSGGGSSSSSSVSSSRSFNNSGFEIDISGELRVQGNDLMYIINRQAQLNNRTIR